MHGSPPLRVPIGPDAHRWSTFSAERTLVVAARTVTSTTRVLECLPALVRDDSRISVVFGHDPTSAFSDGVLDLLRDAGCRIMPWSQLDEAAPDLILSATENVDIPDGDCPVLVLPHGIGFQKMVPDSRSPRVRLSGMVPDSLLESGRAWLAVSHPDQEQQLLAVHPQTAGRTLLVGDPCFDELLAGRQQREWHQRALGASDGRRLVVVSSTWGPTSLIGQDPELPARLLGALPYDEYRVALILHPNVWAAHGSWQIRSLQASALEAGLLLVPPVHSWRPALVAADLVIGDHGSVTLYGASLGTPVLLGAFGEDAVPGTAASVLARGAPRLDPKGELHQQVADAISGAGARVGASVAQHAFAGPSQAHARLRSALYRLLRLPEPASVPPWAPVLGPPAFAPDTTNGCTGLRVFTTLSTEPGGRPTVEVARVPASVADPAAQDRDGTIVHLSCDEDEPDRLLIESASVVVRDRPAATAADAGHWIGAALDRFPGCLLTAIGTDSGAVLVGLRDGRVLTGTVGGPSLDPGLAAAVVYALLRAARPLSDASLTLRLGSGRTHDILLRLRSGPAAE